MRYMLTSDKNINNIILKEVDGMTLHKDFRADYTRVTCVHLLPA